MPNIIAYMALLSWPFVCYALFKKLRIEKAIIWSILGGYLITFAAIGGFAWRAITSGRRLGKQIPDDDKYWT